jgi:ribonuclease VapC
MKVVLDASAILAAIQNEPGGDKIADVLGHALISTVNVAETYTIAERKSLHSDLVRGFFEYRGIDIVPLSHVQAEIAGRMASLTNAAGLSLGDRCCLALAISEKAEVITADRVWLQFAKPLGLTIKSIR